MFLAFEKIQTTLSADSCGQGQGIMGDAFLYALDDKSIFSFSHALMVSRHTWDSLQTVVLFLEESS